MFKRKKDHSYSRRIWCLPRYLWILFISSVSTSHPCILSVFRILRGCPWNTGAAPLCPHSSTDVTGSRGSTKAQTFCFQAVWKTLRCNLCSRVPCRIRLIPGFEFTLRPGIPPSWFCLSQYLPGFSGSISLVNHLPWNPWLRLLLGNPTKDSYWFSSISLSLTHSFFFSFVS